MSKGVWLILVVLFFSCGDEEFTPICIQVRNSTFQNTAEGCVGAKIEVYEFQGNTLHAYTDGMCIADGGTQLIDEACEDVCFIGGIAGLTDCLGVPFFANATLIETIWEEK